MSNSVQYMSIHEASHYTGMPIWFIRHQIKHNQGPAYVSPSPKTKFFTKQALDEWRSSWKFYDATDGRGSF